MLDYRAIEAVQAVLNLQSFEKAAAELHITQSAVSQRIKNLESFYGEPVLIRTLPYRTTDLGAHLLRQLTQVQILEKNFALERTISLAKPKISIAINRDSLETWFINALGQDLILDHVLLEILADDQELTLDYFRRGLVSACLSTRKEPLLGTEVTYLGSMDYILAASPSFMKRYSFKADYLKFFQVAPALKFHENDHLHERYFRQFFSLSLDIPYQIIPSVAGFKKYALLGYGYGLIPQIDIDQELKSGALVNLFSDKIWQLPLYWHMWPINSQFYQEINAQIIVSAQHRLRRPE